MAMAGALHLWNKWEIQILVLASFALQVLLLILARMRRRSISSSVRILLWLMYLLAEYTTTYTLGHMSIGAHQPAGEHQQLMAFWAPFLLVHLGGQDTITAYAMEDSLLWLRHLLTFSVQALGAGYVLYKYIGSSGPLVAPAVLMFVMGVLKNAERVWALGFSRLEIIRRYLNGVSIKQMDGDYYPTTELLDDESVLQGAHDLLYICLGQFVDDKIYPSKFQNNGMKLFDDKGKTLEVVEMQLSLMYDIFYTKAAVIHTWYGRCFRAVSLLGTATAFFLFQFSAVGNKDSYRRADVAVTYILVAGALILEIASVLRAMGSTWTCAVLKANKWDWLHSLHVSLRRRVRIAQTRRWSGSIGQLNLLDSKYTGGRGDNPGGLVREEKDNATSVEARVVAVEEEDNTTSVEGRVVAVEEEDTNKHKRGGFVPRKDKKSCLGSKGISFWRHGSSSRISTASKGLVLKEIQRVVRACEGKEAVMRTYRGQCRLEQGWWSEPDGKYVGSLFLKDLTWSTSMEFDQSILAWHLATHKFLAHSKPTRNAGSLSLPLVEATRAVSNYMMFLLVEHPYMLPPPVRATLHLEAKRVLQKWRYYWRFMERHSPKGTEQVLAPGAKLADQLLDQLLRKEEESSGAMPLLEVVFGVWVEMLCYAAHHCSRESHVRQLNNGGEFITTVWLLTMAEFNLKYYSQENFKEREHGSIWNFMNFVDFKDFMKPITRLLSALISWFSSIPWFAVMECILVPLVAVFSITLLPIRGIILLWRSPSIPDVPGNLGKQISNADM